MAITKGTAVTTSGNLTTGFTLTVPAAVVANDICVIGITNRDATANPTCVDNEGAGSWTRLTTVNANTNGSISIWWKRASASTNGKVVTVGGCTGSASGVLTYFRGASLAAAPFGTPVGEANASADVSQAGITTARDGSMVIHLVGCTSNDTLDPGSRTATTPATITELAEGVSTGGSDCSLSFACDLRSTAGATGTISWTQAGGNGTGASLAVELLPAWTALTADSGSFAFSGTATTLKQGHKVAADSGSFAFTGSAATLRKAITLPIGSGAFAFTGTAATLKRTTIMPASNGAFPFAGTSAGVLVGHKVAASPGAFPFAGTAATLTYTPQTGYTLTAGSGSFVLAGTAAGLRYSRLVGADSGAFAFAGTSATLKHGHRVAADSGSFAIAGTNATLKYSRLVGASSGAFAFTGTSAGLRYGRRAGASSGSFAFAGTDATLVWNTPHKVMPASSGSFAFSGTSAGLAHGRRVSATSAAFAFSGIDVGLRVARRVAAGAAAFPLVGTDAALRQARTVSASSAAFPFAGSAAGLEWGRSLAADSGAFPFTGTAATLTATTIAVYVASLTPVISHTASLAGHNRTAAITPVPHPTATLGD